MHAVALKTCNAANLDKDTNNPPHERVLAEINMGRVSTLFYSAQ